MTTADAAAPAKADNRRRGRSGGGSSQKPVGVGYDMSRCNRVALDFPAAGVGDARGRRPDPRPGAEYRSDRRVTPGSGEVHLSGLRRSSRAGGTLIARGADGNQVVRAPKRLTCLRQDCGAPSGDVVVPGAQGGLGDRRKALVCEPACYSWSLRQ